MGDTVIKDHIETLREKVAVADSPDLMLHSAALKGAGNLTNGSRGDIEAMSDQLALMTAVIVGDRLNERNRHMAICPVAPLLGKNPDGTVNYPWPSRKEVIDFVAELRAEDVKIAASAAGAASAAAAPKSLGSSLRFSIKEGISATGAVAYLTLLVVAIGVGLYFWSGQRDKAIERAVSGAVSEQIRGAMRSAESAGRLSAEEARVE